MGFTMRASALFKLTLLFILVWPLSVHAQKFTVNEAVISKVGNGHTLNARLNYKLTPRVIEALENGVPITFYQEFELSEPMFWIGDYFDWSSTLWIETNRYELRYHALTEQYVLINLDTNHRQSFTSLHSALTELGNIKNFILPPEHLLTLHQNVKLTIQTGLDLHALPTPMRPGALISSKWKLDSDKVPATWQ
jgi:hypothetical protein